MEEFSENRTFPVVDEKLTKISNFELVTDGYLRISTNDANDDNKWQNMYNEIFWENHKIKYILIRDKNVAKQALILRVDDAKKKDENNKNTACFVLYDNTEKPSVDTPKDSKVTGLIETTKSASDININGSAFKNTLHEILNYFDEDFYNDFVGHLYKDLISKRSGSDPVQQYYTHLDKEEFKQGKEKGAKCLLQNLYDHLTHPVDSKHKDLTQQIEDRLEIIFYLEDTGKAGAADYFTVRMCDLIRHGKHQIIFHGAPGTGKTFVSQQIAQSFVWGKMQLDGIATLGERNDLFDYYKYLTENPNENNATMRKILKTLITKLLGDQTPYPDQETLFMVFEEDYKKFNKTIDELIRECQKYKEDYNEAALKEDLWAMQGRMELIQFHPSYDYTDFVEGLRPVEETEGKGAMTFRRVDGSFMRFCRFVAFRNQKLKAEQPAPKYFFIIDEINRADLSKVLGELMFAMESDKRDKPIQTQYSNLDTYFPKPETVFQKPVIEKYGEECESAYEKYQECFEDGFMIPANVVILGTMNDIDRSVESMDFAMRRRFIWEQIKVTQESLRQAFVHGGFFKEVTKDDESVCELLAKAVAAFNQNGLKGDNMPSEFLSGDYDIAQGLFTDIRREDLGINRARLGITVKSIMDYAWKYRISSLLHEYLRGSRNENSLFRNLSNAWTDAWTEAQNKIDNKDDAAKAELSEILYPAEEPAENLEEEKKAWRVCKDNADKIAAEIVFRINDLNNKLREMGLSISVSPDDFDYLPDENKDLTAPSKILEYVWTRRLEWKVFLALHALQKSTPISELWTKVRSCQDLFTIIPDGNE